MYIKTIVLDGFKSYGNRVEVTGFDPEFTAITGLNGTGKSNILDSICFVLGITNLSNVRAGSLQELIYKNGQAGVTKATVSITFDNRDKNQCPIGYENCDEITVTRQVVMGGKNKYLINGVNVQNKRVSDMFCTVQLNVNNPHFLIMQGRITKVLNMKPPEILSMVEEAAGTSMYEDKKQAAQRTIEKKDAKLKELDDLIKEDISPKLDKLKQERTQFQEYQKVVRELETLTRLHIAWKYVTAEKNCREADGKVNQVQLQIMTSQDSIKRNELEAAQLDKQVTELNNKLDEESGSALGELERQVQAAEQAESGAAATHRAASDALADAQKKARLLQRALADDTAALTQKRESLDKVSSMFEDMRAASERSEAALAEAQQRFIAISSGVEAPCDSLQDQLIAAKQEASEASSRVSQSTMEKQHAEKRVKSLENEFKSSSSQYQRDMASVAKLQAEVDQIQSELSGISFDEGRNAELKELGRSLQGKLRGARDHTQSLAARLQRCNFHYTPPQPDFDKRRVSGTVCRLIEVPDTKYCVALETAAGGRLYNVVVDTEVTSKLLLQRGQLETRTTIIPLNKISGHIIPRKTLQIAQEVGGGPEHVQLALDLITYPEHVRSAMAWVFGGTLVCSSLDVAKRVTFHPRVRTRCVTLDGDVFDPSGTLSGGARQKGGSVLVQLAELKQLEAALREDEAQLAQCSAELAALQPVAHAYTQLNQRLEIAQHTLQVTQDRVAATAHAQLHAEIQALRDKINQLTSAIEEDKKIHSEAAARARELEVKVKDIKGHRERELKKAEEALKKAQKEAEVHGGSWRQREQEFETLQLEVTELQAAVSASEQLVQDNRDAAARLQDALHDAENELKQSTEAVKELQAKIKKQKAEISAKNNDIARLVQKKEKLGKKNKELELKVKELEYQIKEVQTEAADCAKRIKSLESEYTWLQSEKQYFGVAGGAYDFGARGEAGVTGARVAQLQERRDRLGRGLNARAHTLLAQEEQQYNELLSKKSIVVNDRIKLVEVIEDLDEKKRVALVQACEQVNRDFGSIFSTLLPGAQARLRPPHGRTVLDGLEVEVGFNGVWKESLGELSGGQRSLVALSLVLAMLRFKPAPLYILDEVDAALDLSHTQNIGRMLKEHFTNSQFIIVSLKDGMFNNANVLFRTRFVDGMSSVQRTVNANQAGTSSR